MAEAGYEVVEHTADLAMRVFAPDLRGLIEQAARGMIDLMLGEIPPPRREVEVVGEGASAEELLVDCLREAGIPAPHRARHPILADDAGILWVTGCAVAARAALSPKTRRVVEITVARDPEEDSHAPK